MKVVLIYSGKGGVGKTTTTANVGKALVEKGSKVYILDADINTPSMHKVFEDRNPVEGLTVKSMGWDFPKAIYIEKAMVRKYLSNAIKEIKSIEPDYVLIDTPPSITDVHINLLEKFEVSGVLMVTQPTDLSIEDVNRTAVFFRTRDLPVIGIIENMVYDGSPSHEYAWELLAKIPFKDGFDMSEVYDNSRKDYYSLTESLLDLDSVLLENKRRLLFDESIAEEDLCNMSSEHYVGLKTRRDGSYKFINVQTWDFVREQIEEVQMFSGKVDALLDACTKERLERLIKAFESDETPYFLITKAPHTEVPLFPGEIGMGSLVIKDSYYGLPCVKYQTKRGEVTLFPHEVMPADEKEIALAVRDGATISSDGRYIPNKPTLEAIYNAFGSRVGIGPNWEEKYDELFSKDLPEATTV